MTRLGVRTKAVAAAAGCSALLFAGAALALTVTVGASLAGLADTTTTVPTTTAPLPDPAPAPKPTPKPKPPPKPVQRPAPKRTYSAPARTYSTPTHTPPSATTHPTKPRATLKHKPRKPKKAVVTTSTPVATTPVPAVLVPVPLGAKGSSTQAGGGDPAITRILFVAGVSFAALLFLLAATVPGTPARFTPVGRIVIEHQQDFVLVGIAAFMITVFVYLLTGHGL